MAVVPSATSPDLPTPPEIWLRTNVRALALGLLVAVGLLSAGISAILISDRFFFGLGLKVIGWLTALSCGYASLMLLYQMRLPRLAYQADELLVYLQSSRPIRVPIEVVELFFSGQGESLVPATSEGRSRSRTVVIRLAEAATQWHNLPIRTALGQWSEAYIILRGTWCEPLTPELFKQLNHRLAEIHRQRRALAEVSA